MDVPIPKKLEEALKKHEKVACLARQVASPNFETIFFQRRTREMGFYPIVLEYSKDVFVSANRDKLSIIRLTFFEGWGKKGGPKISKKYLADIRSAEKMRFCDIINTGGGRGEKIIDFHHEMLKIFCEDLEVIEVSDWLKAMGNGKGARGYYYPFLKFFGQTNACLFENFLKSGREKEFSLFVEEVKRNLMDEEGIIPKILPLLPEESEEREEWGWIPSPSSPEVVNSFFSLFL